MGLLDWASDDDGPWRDAKLRAFDWILALQIATHLWEISFRLPSWDVPTRVVTAGSLALLALMPWARWRRTAIGGLALLEALYVLGSFPLTGNHAYLLCLVAALRAFLDCERTDQQQLFLQAARWLLVIVFFWTGLQKLVNGYYFRAEFFSYCISRHEQFRAVLQHLISGAELQRLTSYTLGVGDGPFRSGSPALIALSNAVWSAEMGLAAALLVPRTRRIAFWLTVVFIVLTEVAARELVFGAVFLNVLLLFPSRDHNRRLLPLFAAFCVWLLLMRAGVVPEIRFS